MSMKRYRVERQGAPKRASQGFTLVEVMIALAILTIALLGVAATTALQSGGIAGNFPFGQAAVTRGYYRSTATMFAQDRLEQVRRLQYSIGPPAVDQIGGGPAPNGAAPATLPDEDFGTIAGYPNFARQVRVQAGTPAATIKTVIVTVNLRLPTDTGMNPESVAISTLIAARP